MPTVPPCAVILLIVKTLMEVMHVFAKRATLEVALKASVLVCMQVPYVRNTILIQK